MGWTALPSKGLKGHWRTDRQGARHARLHALERRTRPPSRAHPPWKATSATLAARGRRRPPGAGLAGRERRRRRRRAGWRVAAAGLASAMDRFVWTSGLLELNETLVIQQRGVRIYDGEEKVWRRRRRRARRERVGLALGRWRGRGGPARAGRGARVGLSAGGLGRSAPASACLCWAGPSRPRGARLRSGSRGRALGSAPCRRC